MPNDSSTPVYKLVVSKGYVQLVREGRRQSRNTGLRFTRRYGDWLLLEDGDPGNEDIDFDVDDGALAAAPEPPGTVNATAEESFSSGRGDKGQSARSLMNMRRTFVSLPWELVGPRPALVSLTYPGEWQAYVPEGRTWEAHRKAFERRWVRRWGEPLVGVWVKEFQASGRPHLHFYVGLPATMRAEDFESLRERTLLRHRLERQYGRYQGRRHTPPIGLIHGGEFAHWLLSAWSEVVGTDNEPDGRHKLRGADVAVMFWNDEAESKTDRTKVAQYLAREAGKWAQKMPPDGFVKVGRFYGIWGKSVGFKPETTTTALEPAVALEVEARLARWVNWRLHVLRKNVPPATALAIRHRGDGVTAFGLGPEQAARILRWSEKAAASRQATGRLRRYHDLSADEVLEVLRTLNP